MSYWKWKALDLAPPRLLDHSRGFRRQLLDPNASPRLATERFQRILERHWKTLSNDEKRNIFMFAEWCARQLDPELNDAARVGFYALLFNNRDRDWSDIVPWLSPFVVANSWSLWEQQLTAEELTHLRSLLQARSETRYAYLLIATQTVKYDFPRRTPLADIKLQLSAQIELPGTPGSIGAGYSFTEAVPEEWEWELSEYIIEGLLAGVTSVEQALPDDGIDLLYQLNSLTPYIEPTADAHMVRQLGELSYAVAKGIASSLWQGILALGLYPPGETYKEFSEHYWHRALRKGKQVRGEWIDGDNGK